MGNKTEPIGKTNEATVFSVYLVVAVLYINIMRQEFFMSVLIMPADKKCVFYLLMPFSCAVL